MEGGERERELNEFLALCFLETREEHSSTSFAGIYNPLNVFSTFFYPFLFKVLLDFCLLGFLPLGGILMMVSFERLVNKFH